jgi:hypothetical protein
MRSSFIARNLRLISYIATSTTAAMVAVSIRGSYQAREWMLRAVARFLGGTERQPYRRFRSSFRGSLAVAS